MSERAAETSAISDAELDLTIAEQEDRHVTVRVVYRTVGDEPDHVGSESVRFPIRGAMPIPVMTTFLDLERRINEALASDDDDVQDAALGRVLTEAHRRIVGLIVEKTPSAFREQERDVEGRGVIRVQPALELDVSQILVLLAWLAGDSSMADQVAKVLTAGQRSTALSAEELREQEGVAGGDAAPLGSTAS